MEFNPPTIVGMRSSNATATMGVVVLVIGIAITAGLFRGIYANERLYRFVRKARRAYMPVWIGTDAEGLFALKQPLYHAHRPSIILFPVEQVDNKFSPLSPSLPDFPVCASGEPMVGRVDR